MLFDMEGNKGRYLLQFDLPLARGRFFLYVLYYSNSGFKINMVFAVITGIFFKIQAIVKCSRRGFESSLNF